ncbi:SDR family oxidoreductase [Rubellicoccus peritrichatus]|uniref:SDR family oxidoreductase n=1 Tax=Rubellicoccus peritrichatus TaxID=3080537 RepID=A0AAQ3LH54_9BACT|nr:SDR family oxidoreductase [Puniceicoccus sp. CR14]WOO42049.1 SDR family oxidoreductase [Puniceicoccus sp. CR14]
MNEAPKRILITGVTRGLGRAMADGFIQRGHTVIGCGRNHTAIDELNQAHPKPNKFFACDVVDDNAVKAFADEVIKASGPPDLLINNAALLNKPAKLWDVPEAEFSQVIDVNIKGVANIIRHIVPSMVKRNSGIIVNLSSGWGRSTAPEVAPYCATKWAIEGLNQAMSQELPNGMACVALNPGIIDTDMLRTAFGEEASSSYHGAEEWAEKAMDDILSYGPADNGMQRSI